MKLLIGTNNVGKIEEYSEIYADLPVTLTSLAAEGIDLDPEETGTTFEANAILKVKAFSETCDLLTLADDSGLEIDALNGEPGIYSARYGNTAKHDSVGRYQIVLDKLRDVPWDQRTARFRCVIALAYRGEVLGTVDGTTEGFIADGPKGTSGFGYDPVFFYPPFNATFGEVSSAQKHPISHRGRAAELAIPLIEQFLQNQP